MTQLPSAPEDHFLLAWGEVGAWRGVSPQSALISVLPQTLLDWNTTGIFKVAHAIGQSQALRHHLVEEVDRLVGTLTVPWLHRAMEDLRHGRSGWVLRWRRYLIKRALSLCAVICQERQQLSLARVQLEAWVRALDNTSQGLMVQREWMDRALNVPSESGREWGEFRKLLLSSTEQVDLLRTHFIKLIDGVECLRTKAALFDEVCNAVPNHEDILRSVTFSSIVSELLAVPASCIPVTRE